MVNYKQTKIKFIHNFKLDITKKKLNKNKKITNKRKKKLK